MKKVNLKKLAILGLTGGMALTAQGVFADANTAAGTTVANKCGSGCGAFGSRTKANHQRDMDDSDDDVADNTGTGPTTIPVQPIAPSPRSLPNNPDTQNRFNNPGQQSNQAQFQNQSQQTMSGQRNLDQGMQQKRLPVESK